MTTTRKEPALGRLRIDHMESPLALDNPRPVFSWQMQSERTGAKQCAYRIVIRSAEGTVWDSEKTESSESVGISYPESAAALKPETDYRFELCVWDDLGTELRAGADFSTGLMSDTVADWHGAKWIGPDEITIAAETIPVFRMRYTMRIEEGGTEAGILFGASDPRLNTPTRNNYLIGGENYIACCLDVSSLPAKLKVYRKGYCPADNPEVPIEIMTVPESVIRSENRFQDHAFEIVISGNQMEYMTVDGVKLETSPENVKLLTNFRRPHVDPTHLILNPLKDVLDVPIYPRLCSVGFVTDGSTKAVYTDFAVHHFGGEQARIFGPDTGAKYDIFAGKPGLDIQGDRITASAGTLAYADPSWAAVPMFRKEFTAKKPVSSAKVYAASWGIYELLLNGRKVGDEYLASGDMDFSRRIYYTAYDVTSLLQEGANAIGATVASGWFGDEICYDIDKYNFYGDRQAFLGLVAVTYTDGTKEYFPTDEGWQYYGEGPVRYAGNFNGEIYDARREAAIEGWDRPGFSGDGWKTPALMGNTVLSREPKVNARPDPGIRKYGELTAVYEASEERGGDTVYIYDMGINMVGVPEITFPEGVKGRQITIRYAEIRYPRLSEDNPYYYGELGGMILTENLRGALVTDRYTMKGEKNEVFRPLFTFHGYRYVEISGIDAPIPGECIKGILLSSVEPSARYESSNALTNQLFKNIVNSTLGNFLSIPTDCPQRDERLGWAGDAQVYSETATYIADVEAFYRNYNLLQRDAQGADGTFHLFAPSYSEPGVAFALGYTWNAAGIVIPWQTYLQYGDRQTLEENYPNFRLHIEGMRKMTADGYRYLSNHIGFLGDHLSVVPSDPFLMDNAQYYRSVRITQEAAEILGLREDAKAFKTLAEGIREEWNRAFVSADHRTQKADGTPEDTQASYALPIACGVFSEENLPYAYEYLDEACKKTGHTMTTGFMGTGPLLPALTEGGHADEAYTMFEHTGYPSWLYPVVNGATSVWERWNSYTIENGFSGQNHMNSFNHYSLGAVGTWMMEYQAGIQRDKASGFRHFILQPVPGGTFTHLNAAYDSIYGAIESEWTAEDGRLSSYRAVVPANTTATLYLPLPEEKAAAFASLPGASFSGMEMHLGRECAKFELQSGSYHMAATEK